VTSAPLLQTKLYAPRLTHAAVDRPRLTQVLRGRLGERSSVVLVSAPAGFGKSTILAQALLGGSSGQGSPSVAWLSLDDGDSDPETYWGYVLAALRKASPEVGASAASLLEAPGSTPITTVLTSLINDLASSDQDLVLVLDDYHVIHQPVIHEAMTFLVDHLPSQLRLVVATRSDPPLPLARLRARGELVEVRAADLRFTEPEAAAYFEAMGLTLSPGELTTLEGRTEGWVAALQLAALSLQGRDDAAGFIDGFAGDDRHVVDYLVEEVVQRQSAGVHDFLLRTSVLPRLSGSLTDAVTGRNDGRAMLESLDRDNLFVVPLDDQRRWYRYHHLFADMLRARLLDELPDEVPELHRRASAWHEQDGDMAAAIDHAVAAGDADRAAGLVEAALPAMTRERREARLRRWMEALPDDVFARRPVLANGYVGALMSTGEIRGVEPRLQIAERWIEMAAAEPGDVLPAGLLFAHEQEWRQLPARVAIQRAGLSLMAGDVAATMDHAQRALDALGPDEHLGHGAATALRGLASWRLGDLAAAEAAYAETIRHFVLARHVPDILGCTDTLADLRLTLGRLRDAERAYREALDLAEAEAGPVRGTPDMYVGLASCLLERGDIEAARLHLRMSHDFDEHLGLPRYSHRWRLAESRIRAAEGDLGGALAMLDEAEQVYDLDFSPDAQPVGARRARIWVRQGRPDLALAWAAERGLKVTDELAYLREFEHLTLARALLAAGDAEVVGFLGRLLAAARAGGRLGSALEILLLRALAFQQAGDARAALDAVAQALEMAEPEGYVRTFLDEGPAMAALLTAAASRGIAPPYVARVLGARDTTPVEPAPLPQGLVDPLSERELDVLRLLASELSGPEIARHLVVSLNTVRTHTKSIYAKLGVGSRRAAVRRAEDLGLLRR
jgi:LuxR family maltose regulon positive regulatory protein